MNMSNTTHFCLLSHRAYGSAFDIYEIIYIYERYKRSELKRVKPLCLKYIKEDIDIVHMKNTEKASCIFTLRCDNNVWNALYNNKIPFYM